MRKRANRLVTDTFFWLPCPSPLAFCHPLLEEPPFALVAGKAVSDLKVLAGNQRPSASKLQLAESSRIKWIAREAMRALDRPNFLQPSDGPLVVHAEDAR